MGVSLSVQNYFIKSVIPEPWTRPSDWPGITAATNEVQFLFSDINDASCTIRTTFSRTSGSQNIVIDWGDSSSNTVTTTTSTDTTHVYTPGAGTPCSRGYTTFKIRVYFTGTGVSTLTSCRILPIFVAGNTQNRRQECAVLEIYHGDGTQTVSMSSYYDSNTGLAAFHWLEYFRFPSSITFTDTNSMFIQCTSLSRVDMPLSASSLTTVTTMFQNCRNLRSLNFPSNATGITSLNNTFQNCYELTGVTFPTTLNSCTNFSTAFQNCYALKNVTLPSINNATNFQQTFQSCTSLEWAKFTSLPTFGATTTVTMSSCFNACVNLRDVYFPTTCSANANFTFDSVFQASYNLKEITFPTNFNPSTMASCFNTCDNLKRVVFQSPMSRCTNMSSCFNSCYNLNSVTLPSSFSSAGVDFGSTFQSCRSLPSVTLNSGINFTSLVQTFQSCTSLKSVNWSPGTQNSITSLFFTFQSCVLLERVTLPTSMTAVTNLNQTFGSCTSLTGVTFPSTMNSVTTMDSCFENNYKLVSITLPTGMTSCTNFFNTFGGCATLTGVTYPTTVSTATTTFSFSLYNCHSLKQVTFPSASQLTLVNTISNLFQSCSNLTTINNFDKIGSNSTTGTICVADSNSLAKLTSISFVPRLSRLTLAGTNSTTRANVQSVRLLNTGTGQWGGSSPQINVSNTNMSTAQLVQLFNDMAAQGAVVSKTINITTAVGTPGLTAADRSIITSIGWTITG